MSVAGKRLTRKRLAPAVAIVVLGVVPLLAGSTAGAETTTFSNTAQLNIPAPGQFGPPWKANVYPSTIPVSGMTGTITDVNVAINNINCAANGGSGVYPDDMDVLLVGPAGQDTMLISDVYGDYNTSVPLSGVTLTLDDAAANLVPANPANGAPASGTFKPTDDDTDLEELPVVKFTYQRGETPPTSRFTGPTPSGNALLSTYNGTAPNGTWSLFYVDDVAGFEDCEFLGGWSLTITTTGPTTTTTAPTTTTTAPTTTTTAPTTTTTAPTTTTTAPTTTTTAPTTTTTAPTTTTTAPTTTTTTAPSADLRILKTASASSIGTGRRLVYTVKANNLGPSPAANVVLTEDLPDDFTITSTIPSACTLGAGNVVTCNYASLAKNNKGVSLKVTGKYFTPGVKRNVASVSAATPDPNPANNTTVLDVTIT